MTLLMQITFWLAVINIALLVYLTIAHLRMMRSIKTSFTIGLLLFVLVFLIHNILAAYFYLTMMELYAVGAEIPVFIITLIETIAFSIFVWIIRQ